MPYIHLTPTLRFGYICVRAMGSADVAISRKAIPLVVANSSVGCPPVPPATGAQRCESSGIPPRYPIFPGSKAARKLASRFGGYFVNSITFALTVTVRL